MSSLFKNLLIALVVAVIIWLGYFFFIKNKDEAGEGTAPALSTAASIEAQAFLLKLQRLQAIKLDEEIFSDPRFNALTDFRQDVQPEPVGRDNPFAPIE